MEDIFWGYVWPFIIIALESVLLLVVLLIVIAYVLYADRKIWAAVQIRRGPNVVGPWGLFQSFADLIKFALKEPIIPAGANKGVFVLAPLVTCTLALAAWAVIWVLAGRGVRPTTRSLLLFEVVSVCLILVLMGAIFWHLTAGTAPGGQRPSGSVFVLPPGVGIAALSLAATSGFLAFAGFESAGSLGEESLLPKRMIPRAIITAVAFGAVFYLACIVAQTLGFGTGPAGVSAFQHAQARDPPRHRHRGRLRRRLLCGLHHRPDARVRHRRGGRVRLPPVPGATG